ncbi:MAG: patatin-like phospholipase family protein [Gammaproteobacteria bacterium]|nr:patatin-like phospholipase family protein [Gammaproteobacteria bacterium]MDH3507978.1 patatin-like phospholipase family protein [Gammaproteobacteria bacterium]
MSLNNYIAKALLALSFATLCEVASAQADDAVNATERPRVGLVLSGGGARGGVHVGVLRALEELNVPVDFIAGTSIGAVIGGFYAAGMTADGIEGVINSLDWEAAFLEDTPRALRSFRRKREDDLFLVDERPGFNNLEFQLPVGIVQGQIIDLIMAETTLAAALVTNFDALPIPFRAVAADIATGEAVILGNGNLANALRASMSVPAVLAPIEMDGRLLVDGGIVMNLPVEVAREMGADVIIAVDVSAPLIARDALDSVLDITAQLTTLLTRYGVVEQLEKLGEDDLLLTAEVDEQYGSTSFESMAATIPFGYELAMSNAPALRELALESDAYEAHRAAQLGLTPAPPSRVDFVRINNDSIISDRVIERYLADIEIGGPLDLEQIETTVNKIYGLGLYQNVRYQLVEENEQTGLAFDLDERSWGPGYAQLGLQFNASGNQDVLFGVSASYLRTALNPKNGEWRATAAVGAQPALHLDFHQPFGQTGQYFFAPSLKFDSTLLNLFDDGNRVTEARVKTAALELAVGREFRTWGEFRLGLRRTTGDVDIQVGQLGLLPEGPFDRGEFFARLSADTLDDVAFPRSGVSAVLEWRGSRPDTLSADFDFDQLSFSANFARTWARYTLLSTIRYDTTIDGVAPLTSEFRFGGLFDLSGLGRQMLSAQNAGRIGASFYRQVNDLALFPAFVGASLEYGNVWATRETISFDDALLGGSIWVGIDTPVGPIYGAYGRTRDRDSSFYLVLGRIF